MKGEALVLPSACNLLRQRAQEEPHNVWAPGRPDDLQAKEKSCVTPASGNKRQHLVEGRGGAQS